MSRDVVVISTGTANTASVVAALERTGCRVELSRDPNTAATAGRLVLPGVGSFAPVASGLAELGLTAPLRERIADGRPTLAICLGLQLLATASEEDPDVPGLGLVPATVTRFATGLRVPHMGWNRVRADAGCRLLEDGAAYFANSYKLDDVPDGWLAATAEHGGGFVAAMERRAVLACQFHPELSGPWGQALLERWLEAAPC